MARPSGDTICPQQLLSQGGTIRRRRRRRLILCLAVPAIILGVLSHCSVRTSLELVTPAAAWSFFGLGRCTEEEGPADPIERAKWRLPRADAVIFDVDSTVLTTEGIDLLARCFDVEKDISELTTRAMAGNMTFQDSLRQRLKLMAERGMTRDSLLRCLDAEGAPQFSPGVKQLIARLHAERTDVYLVSGGFDCMVRPVATTLGIPQENVYANTILFNEDGTYMGFDEFAPTSRSGGKPAILRQLRRRKRYKHVVVVGDGVTDLEARAGGPEGSVSFIGYGGVVARAKVQEGADWFIYSFQELLDILPARA